MKLLNIFYCNYICYVILCIERHTMMPIMWILEELDVKEIWKWSLKVFMICLGYKIFLSFFLSNEMMWSFSICQYNIWNVRSESGVWSLKVFMICVGYKIFLSFFLSNEMMWPFPICQYNIWNIYNRLICVCILVVILCLTQIISWCIRIVTIYFW